MPLADAVIGAMAGYLSLWTICRGCRLLIGREALGYGDFKLLAALGAWLGWQALPPLLLAAALAGIVLTLLARLCYRRSLSQPLPFGPLLAASGWGLFLLQAAGKYFPALDWPLPPSWPVVHSGPFILLLRGRSTAARTVLLST